MSTNRQDKPDVSTRRRRAVGDVPRPGGRTELSDSAIYRPTLIFRQLLNRSGRVGRSLASAVAVSSSRHASEIKTPAPGLAPFLALACLLGVASGFLELAMKQLNAHFQGHIGWGSLTITQHIAWMVPLTAPFLIMPLSVMMVWPVLGLLARRRKLSPTKAAKLAWGWTGTVLGMLLFLGPIISLRLLHPPAAIILSLGIGFRLRHWLVRPIAGTRGSAYWGAGFAIVALAGWSSIQWSAVGRTPDLALAPTVVDRPNLLWIVADTLSAEHMSLYGYGRQTTPELEKWTKQGITFEMASSAAPWTLPSHITMFTGLWPFEHGARVDRAYRGAAPTIAEHLRAQGYQTAGLAANVRMCNHIYGVGRGFDHYVDYPCNNEISPKAMIYNSALGATIMQLGRRISLPFPEPFSFDYQPTARALTADGREWIDRASSKTASAAQHAQRPFFLFLNFMDVHGPYQPPPGVDARFWSGPTPAKTLATPGCGWDALHARETAAAAQRGERQHQLDDVSRRLVDLYDQCIYGLDAELGRFLGELRASGRLANTWVIITSDHGEQFGEHNQFGHGSGLYNEQTHVPLVLIPPVGPEGQGDDSRASLRGRRVSVPVSLRDLPKTITELLVAKSENNPFPGRNLADFWSASGPVAADPVLAQLEEPHLEGDDFSENQAVSLNSVIDDNFILIESRTSPPELYALDDRKQTRNLAGDPAQQQRLQHMRRKLAAVRRVTADR